MSNFLDPFMFDVDFSFSTDSIFVNISNETKDLPPPPPAEGNFILLQGVDFSLLDGGELLLL